MNLDICMHWEELGDVGAGSWIQRKMKVNRTKWHQVTNHSPISISTLIKMNLPPLIAHLDILGGSNSRKLFHQQCLGARSSQMKPHSSLVIWRFTGRWGAILAALSSMYRLLSSRFVGRWQKWNRLKYFRSASGHPLQAWKYMSLLFSVWRSGN